MREGAKSTLTTAHCEEMCEAINSVAVSFNRVFACLTYLIAGEKIGCELHGSFDDYLMTI